MVNVIPSVIVNPSVILKPVSTSEPKSAGNKNVNKKVQKLTQEGSQFCDHVAKRTGNKIKHEEDAVKKEEEKNAEKKIVSKSVKKTIERARKNYSLQMDCE